jgi:DNA-binding NtrC family response regulator
MNQGGLVEPADLVLDAGPALRSTGEDPRNAETGPIEYDLLDAFPAEELPTSVVRAELERRELRHMKDALQRTAGNQTEAARLLGISRRTLMNRMDRFGISRPRKGPGRSGSD